MIGTSTHDPARPAAMRDPQDSRGALVVQPQPLATTALGRTFLAVAVFVSVVVISAMVLHVVRDLRTASTFVWNPLQAQCRVNLELVGFYFDVDPPPLSSDLARFHRQARDYAMEERWRGCVYVTNALVARIADLAARSQQLFQGYPCAAEFALVDLQARFPGSGISAQQMIDAVHEVRGMTRMLEQGWQRACFLFGQRAGAALGVAADPVTVPNLGEACQARLFVFARYIDYVPIGSGPIQDGHRNLARDAVDGFRRAAKAAQDGDATACIREANFWTRLFRSLYADY